MLTPTLYLASASPRRRALLEQIGCVYVTVAVAVDETQRTAEAPAQYVERLALAKAQAAWTQLGELESGVVLGADTAVVLEGEIFGKPQDRAHGLAMLARLAGRTHEVLTAVARVNSGQQAVRLCVSRVSLRALTQRECEAYWASGEPIDKAGGYAIQGRAATFITHLEGSYSGVMGLPLYETAELLRAGGIDSLAWITPT